jgi:hypothetical protein
VLSIGVPYRSALAATDLRQVIARHVAADPRGELDGVVLIASADEAADLPMPDYARALLRDAARLKTLV